MKRLSLFFAVFMLSCSVFAQRTIQMRNLWIHPKVHVFFEGYTVSFTVKDINRALVLLCETGDTSFGTTSGLDTGKDYQCELYSGVRMEYRNSLQHLLQNGVGAFLILSGHAYIQNSKKKQLQSVIADIKEFPGGVTHAYIIFTDPRDGKRLFTGRMSADMYNKDMGIE